MLKIMIPENWAEKPPPSFCLFVRDLTHVVHVEYPWSPYYKSALRFPPIKMSSIGYQLCQLFQILTYTEVQDTGLLCRWKAYGSPTTIHTNMPAITVTLLPKELSSVIRILSL